MLVYILKM